MAKRSMYPLLSRTQTVCLERLSCGLIAVCLERLSCGLIPIVAALNDDLEVNASGIDNIYPTAPCSRKGCDCLVRASNVLV
jgi:hypothetical protein